jgi:hypothetical protein
MVKTKIKLTNLDIDHTNVYLRAAEVWKALNDANMPEQAATFVKKLSECRNSGEALELVKQYVDIS